MLRLGFRDCVSLRMGEGLGAPCALMIVGVAIGLAWSRTLSSLLRCRFSCQCVCVGVGTHNGAHSELVTIDVGESAVFGFWLRLSSSLETGGECSPSGGSVACRPRFLPDVQR